MTAVKVWDGSAWVDSTITEKVWNGSAWVEFAPAAGGPEAIAWPSAPTLTNGNDTDTYNMGVEFHTTADGSWVGIEWNPVPDSTPAPAGGQHYAQAWSGGGSLLTPSQAFTPAAGGSQQQILFDTPQAITASTTYVATIYTVGYCFRSNTSWDETSPSGRIVADHGRLRIDNSGNALFPSGTFDAIYYISPLVEF